MSKKQVSAVPYEIAVSEGVPGLKPINPTGMRPVEYKVLIRLDPVEEKTAGGVIMPDFHKDRRQQATTKAVLVDMGGNAFEDFKGLKPERGNRVLVDAYAGAPAEKGDFEDLYRFCQDKDVIAVIDQ